VPTAGDGEVTIAVPPLNTSPLRVGPMATAAGPTEDSTDDGGGLTAGRLAMGAAGTARRVAALASPAVAAIASAVMMPNVKAAGL
jgi:hypothetical protein